MDSTVCLLTRSGFLCSAQLSSAQRGSAAAALPSTCHQMALFPLRTKCVWVCVCGEEGYVFSQIVSKIGSADWLMIQRSTVIFMLLMWSTAWWSPENLLPNKHNWEDLALSTSPHFQKVPDKAQQLLGYATELMVRVPGIVLTPLFWVICSMWERKTSPRTVLKCFIILLHEKKSLF